MGKHSFWMKAAAAIASGLLVAGLFTLLWHRQVTPQPHARGALRTGVAFAVGLCLP